MEPFLPNSEVRCEYELGVQGLEFLREALSSGGPLAREVYRHVNLEGAFTRLPPDVPRNRLLEFAFGGFWQGGQASWREWITGFFLSQPDAVAIGENFEIEPESHLLRKLTHYLVVDNAVVFTASASHADSLESLLANISRFPSILLLCNCRSLVSSTRIQSHDMEAVARSTQYVMVGAYDEESYVVGRAARE